MSTGIESCAIATKERTVVWRAIDASFEPTSDILSAGLTARAICLFDRLDARVRSPATDFRANYKPFL
ncbi:hypothetical protein [Microcoleus sp. bin38.metabat.b11b12b14.051]|uniref:hypothetical protein n=1 Tax=Microcoleus sp. bin38.metabat.b11b12b14.051 TaxID=2742709 RepID=UPI0025D1C6F7|nr:hypothetical protein [Microcoleus sp. bin38.metabat.b11b12b14.051]